MKHILTFLLIIVSATTIFALENSDSLKQRKILYYQGETILVSQKDTLNLIVTQHKESVNNFDWQINMPWIAAILIGILTVIANIIISRQSRISNTNSLKQQLDHAKDIALAQLETSKQNMKMDFNKTVLSGNRQVWINDLRELMTKILTRTESASLKQKISDQEFEEIRFLITKAELTLNATKDEEFISSLKELELSCYQIIINKKEPVTLTPHIKKVKEYTLTTLKTEWERVKKGE
jgi:hypothetical protein